MGRLGSKVRRLIREVAALTPELLELLKAKEEDIQKSGLLLKLVKRYVMKRGIFEEFNLRALLIAMYYTHN